MCIYLCPENNTVFLKMIKQAANYIMSFLLLFSVIGININKHYSGNELYSVSVYSEPESCCNEPCDCCNETTEFFQLTDVFLPSILYHKQIVKVIKLNIWFNDFKVNLFSKEYIRFSLSFYRYLKYPELQTQAQLQCFKL